MSGKHGPKAIVWAAKADILSLTNFEVGLFGCVVVCPVGIWGYRLEILYWWMMQVGMFLGFWLAMPVNWWLIKKGIRKPCT